MVCGITYHVVCHCYPQASTCEHQAEIETRELETRLRSEAAIELEAALVASRDAAEQHLSAQAEAARRETASAIEFAVAAAEERELIRGQEATEAAVQAGREATEQAVRAACEEAALMSREESERASQHFQRELRTAQSNAALEATVRERNVASSTIATLQSRTEELIMEKEGLKVQLAQSQASGAVQLEQVPYLATDCTVRQSRCSTVDRTAPHCIALHGATLSSEGSCRWYICM